MSAVAHIDVWKTGKFFTDEFRGDMSWNGYEWANLLRNEGPDSEGHLKFTDVAKAVGADDQLDARGFAIADYDNDGDLDLAINHCPGDRAMGDRARATVLYNQIGSRRSWLAVELVGTRANRDAVGSLITIRTGDGEQLRRVSIGEGYASQHTLRQYFGLGEASQVDGLTVQWPDGTVEEFEGVPARRLVRIVEGEGMEVLDLPTAVVTADRVPIRSGGGGESMIEVAGSG